MNPTGEKIKMPHHIPRGLLGFLILRLLEEGNKTGSEIMDVLYERSKKTWKPSPGSIYPLLSSMEEAGLIEIVEEHGRSKVYGLTDKGDEKIKHSFKKKGRLHERANLGPRLWHQLLTPSDQIRFHAGGLEAHIATLFESIDTLNQTQKNNLLCIIDKNIEALKELRDALEGD